MMNSRISLQQFKVLFFVQCLFAILLNANEQASAVNIKDTNYSIPSGAYFVSPSGKNTNSGKANAPWSVAKALVSAPSGATIVFRGGTYRDVNSLNVSKKLTLQAYPHEKVWIKGSVTVTGWVADGKTWRKDGWNYSFPREVGSEYLDSKYPLAGHRDMVYVNGTSLRQVSSKAKVVAGTFYVDPGGNKLYIGTNPGGKTVEATAKKGGLNIQKSGTVVRGLGFAQYADQAVRVVAPSVTVENNAFAWNGIEGVKLSGTCSDATIRGNSFSYNGRKGLSGSHAHRMYLEGNTISYNNVENFRKEWDAAGIKIIKTDGVRWRNNLVEHNNGNGMWADESSTNATIANNTARYNDNIGIFFELSHKAIIAANVAYNNSLAGVMLSNSSSARVYNNTLVNNGKGLRVKDTTRNNTNAAEVAKGITWVARNNVFKNNIISDARGSSLFDASNCGVAPSSSAISAADYNAYYRKSSSKPSEAVRWSVKGKCTVSYKSVLAFKLATGYEDNALVIDNVATNPFFVDAANGDYRLKSGSRAIGRGQALPTDIASAIGVKAGVPVDLGALQSKTSW